MMITHSSDNIAVIIMDFIHLATNKKKPHKPALYLCALDREVFLSWEWPAAVVVKVVDLAWSNLPDSMKITHN